MLLYFKWYARSDKVKELYFDSLFDKNPLNIEDFMEFAAVESEGRAPFLQFQHDKQMNSYILNKWNNFVEQGMPIA